MKRISQDRIGHEMYMLMLEYHNNPYPGLEGTFEKPIEVVDGVFVIRPFKGLEQRIEEADKNHKKIYVVADVDQTISWEREGWQDLMVPIYTQFLVGHSNLKWKEAEKEVIKILESSIGKPTMVQTAATINLCYENGYNYIEKGLIDTRELQDSYNEQRRSLSVERHKKYSGEELRIAGTYNLLKKSHEKGYEIILGSGSDKDHILETRKVLKMNDIIDKNNIFAPGDDIQPWQCAKKYIVDMLKRKGVKGHQMIGVGDAPADFYWVYAEGGIPIAIISQDPCEYNDYEKAGEEKKGHFTIKNKFESNIKGGAAICAFVDDERKIDYKTVLKIVHEGFSGKGRKIIRV